ncbi:MAG: flagellar basal-body rod protein FlgG [SAR324 cluster bacterium]|uniref:Flagellar basal-body rod protein FlgG n=1 Tax=SAR324 cluster bacterium TaxID=2024889 RepID=A0A7X9FPD9_9DELT|nr:flagellar basal-body rod protein FlgG [SAR324 cluster bacterium]
MIRSLYSAATGMTAQELNVDTIANNLANVNTIGFKKTRAEFQDLVYQYLVEPGAPTSQTTKNPSGIQVGLGVKPAATQRIFSQGDLQSTSNTLDVAIEGDGFFEITKPDGTIAYTRAGSFQLNENGDLVTSDGYTVSPGIPIPAETLAISIAQDGKISVRTPGNTTSQEVGQLTAVRFANNAGLRAVGHNLYEETESSGAPVSGQFSENGFGRLTQGFLESSNVSVVEQVVNMITAQRAYEANSKSIQTADDMLSRAINVKR